MASGSLGVCGGRLSRDRQLCPQGNGAGFLVPTVGVAKIFPPHAGLVTALDVHEGQVVVQGAPLLTVQVGETDSQGGDVDAAVLQALSRQRGTLVEQIRLEQTKTSRRTDPAA